MTPLIIPCPVVTFFVLAISTLSALDSVLTEHKRVLLPPTNLSVVFDDYNSVVVYWNYTEPEHVQTSEIIFIGSIVSEKNETSQHVLSSSRKPHHDQWRNLRPRTKYTLNLCAAHPKWERSPAIRSSFITLADDYPTPLIKDVTPRNWRQALDYSVKWELWPESEHLLYFDIILCTDDCTFTRVPSSDFEATVPINFYTRFSLSVMAYYDAPMIGIVRRESPASPGLSEVGAPSEVNCITKFAQLGNILEIEWEPPVPSNGPVNYYETFVFDPLNLFSYSWKNVTTEPKVTLMAPLIRGSLYRTRIRAVNIDSKNVHHRGDFAFFDNERVIPPSEVFVEVLCRDPHRVHFRLIPALGQSNILFHLESQVKLSRAGLEFNEAEAFNLKPNQMFSVSVQTCYVTKDVSTHTCAGYFHIKLKSNVDRPSEVQDLLAVITNKPTVAFVTWKVPESPNGPINAYIIHALSNKPGYPVPHLEKYRTNDTWLSFEKTLAQELLEIRVAAVNLDVDDDSIELIGPWTSAPRPYPKEYHESDHLNLLVILVFVTALASTVILVVDSDFRSGEIILRYIRRLRRRRIRRVDLLDGVPDQQRAPAPEAGLDLIADIH